MRKSRGEENWCFLWGKGLENSQNEGKVSRLELLSLFDQSNRANDQHFLNIEEAGLPERYRPLLRRLLKAVAAPLVRETMDAEDDLIEELKDYQRLVYSTLYCHSFDHE